MLRLACLLVGAALAISAAPCIAAAPNCTEWVTLGTARSLVYRTYSLETKNPAITRAFILVYGAGRDADHYFSTAVAAAFLGGALEDTIVISPRFASNDSRGCRDSLAPREVNWSCKWR